MASVLVPVLVITRTPLVAIDLAYQLRAGDIVLHTHSVLRTDPFTATATAGPWLNQQWLAQILLAAVFRLGGWLGLAVLRGALAGVVLAFVFMACRAAGAPTKRAAWLTLPSGALLPAGFQLRPQLFAMVCFAVTAWLVARRWTRPGGQWLVVPSCGRTSTETSFSPPFCSDWPGSRTDRREVRSRPPRCWRPGQPPRDDGEPLRSRVLQDRPATRSERRDPASPLNAAIVSLLMLAIVAMLIPWLPYTGRSMPTGRPLLFAPVGITRELHRILTPGQVLFNPQVWGSWLEFEFPRNPVLVDSRIEVVPTSVWWKYYAVSRGSEGWQAILDSWHVDVAVLARDQQMHLIPRMKADPGWRLVYEDAEGLIFARDGRYSGTPTETRPAFAATRIAATRLPTPSFL